MSRRVPYFAKLPNVSRDILQGPVILDIHITVDGKGLMKTSVSGNPLPNVVQVVTALVDSLKGYMDSVNKQASLIIDPNKPKTVKDGLNGGTQEENHNDG